MSLFYKLKSGVASKAREFASNPEKRRKALLALMFAALAAALIVLYLSFEGDPKYQAFLMCSKCRNLEARDIESIYGAKCSKCGGEEGFAYKCESCRFEFPYIPKDPSYLKNMKLEEYRKFRSQEAKCPNCFSMQTHEMDTP